MITVIAPSRGRPQRFHDMAMSAHIQAIDFDHTVLGVLDIDDPTTGEYTWDSDFGIETIVVQPQEFLSNYWNIGAADNPDGFIFMMGADDLIFRTEGWDYHVMRAFAGAGNGPMMVYANDGNHYEALSTHPFVNRAWIEAVGFTYPKFSMDFADAYVNLLAANIGRQLYLPHVLIEHMHPGFGKAENDDTYISRRVKYAEAVKQWEYARTDPLKADVIKLSTALRKNT